VGEAVNAALRKLVLGIILTFAAPVTAQNLQSTAPQPPTMPPDYLPGPPADDVFITASVHLVEHTLSTDLFAVGFVGYGFEYPGVGETLNDVRWVRNFGDDWVVITGLWRSIEPDEFVAGILNVDNEPRVSITLESFHQGLTGEPKTLENEIPAHHGWVEIADLLSLNRLFTGIIRSGDVRMESFSRRGPWVDATYVITVTAFDRMSGNVNDEETVTLRVMAVGIPEIR
jgi:hypothetical protein